MSVARLALLKVLIALVVVVACATANASQPQDLLLRDFFATTPIYRENSKGIDERFAILTTAQRDSVLNARSVLINFFRSTQQPDQALAPFLGIKLALQYPQRRSLMDALLGQEVSIQSLTVVGFDISDQLRIDLNYYIVIFADGNYLLREDTATFAKEKAVWKIVKIGGIGVTAKNAK